MSTRQRRLRVMGLTVVCVVVIFGAQNWVFGAEYPTRSIEWLVGYGPGGSASMGGRIVAQSASEVLGRPVVIVNKAGAGGAVAAAYVARAKPDGYTLLLYTAGIKVAPMIRSDVRYKDSDFQPIAMFGIQNWGFIVKADSPWKTVGDLIEYAKNHPGGVKATTAGVGTTSDFILRLFNMESGVKIDPVPVKSGAEATQSLLGRHTSIAVHGVADTKGFVDSGMLRALAVASEERDPDFPKVPTFKEQGLSKVVEESIYGIVMPAGVPDEIAKKLSTAFGKAILDPDVTKTLKQIGFLPVYKDAEQFAKFLDEKEKVYRRVIKETGMKFD